MAIELENLASEVKKIVTAPYLVCLKGLHNILRDSGDEFDPLLRQWADVHQADIPALAYAIVQGLTQWPYVLDLVEQLSHVLSFRDSLLEISPPLLDQLLDKAVESDASFDQYAPVCLTLLHSPLAAGIALPTSAQTLLWKFFEKAVSNPNAITVEAVYLLLDGACWELLCILPEHGLEKLRVHLTKIMRNAKGIEDQLLSLLCLAIISKTIAPQKSHLASRSNSATHRNLQLGVLPDVNEAEKFFVGERASKTMHLLVLQVIYACRTENTTAEAPNLKLVRLARAILTSIAQEHRQSWAINNPSIFKKLQEKITLEQLPILVRLEAMSFLSMLFLDVNSVQTSVLDCYQDAFRGLSGMKSFDRHLNSAFSTTLSFFAPRLDETFWQKFFQMYQDGLTKRSHKASSCYQWLLSSLMTLETVCGADPKTRNIVVRALSSSSICEMLDNLDTPNDTGDNVLLRQFCASLLRISVNTRAGELALETFLTLKLITKLQSTCNESIIKPIPRIRPSTAITLLTAEQICAPHEYGASHQWRERLSFELKSDVAHRQESIVKLVGEICRDLESRCENVEEPLKAKQAEYEELKNEYSKLQAVAARLEAKSTDSKEEIAVLEEMKSCTDSEIDKIKSDLADLNERYQELEKLHERIKEESKYTLSSTRHEFENQKLELQASLACHIEKIDDYATEAFDLQQSLSTTKAEAKIERERNQELQDSLEATVADLKAAVETEKSLKLEAERSLEGSLKCKSALEKEIASLEIELRRVATELERSDETNRDIRQAHENNVAELRSEHDRIVLNLRSEAALEKQRYETCLENTKAELVQTSELHNGLMRQQEQDKKNLQRQIKAYADESREKSDQLEEAHQMKSRLLSALGLTEGLQGPAWKESNKFKQQAAKSEKSSVLENPPSPATFEIGEAEVISEDFGGLGANLTASSGSSPKRAKPRALFQSTRLRPARAAKNTQMASSVRSRRSMHEHGLGNGSLNSLNATRRQSENPKFLVAFPDVASSTQSEVDDLACEQTSHEVTPEDQENSKRLCSTGDTYYGALAAEDFDASTVEL